MLPGFNHTSKGTELEPQENTPALQPNLNMIPQLPAAFAKAQGAFEVPKKTKHYLIQNKPVKYADLADVIEAVRKPLADNGLSITHRIGFCKGPFGLTTVLMHESGETLETWYPLPDASKIQAQQFGGALTYARRYSVSALLGISSDDDTDGEGVGPADAKGAPKDKAPAGPKAVVAVKPKEQPKAEDVPQQAPIELDENYVIPFGPVYVKGKVMKDLDPNVVKTFFNTVVDTASAKNQEIKGEVLVFCAHAEAYLEANR